MGCGVVIGWTGVGAVACGAAGSAVGSITHDLVEGGHDVGDMAGNAVVNGAIGGVTGGAMFVGGKLLGAGVRSIVSKVGANKAAGTASSPVTNAQRGAATEVAEQASAKAKPIDCHSFDPRTPVAMANGAYQPIEDVEVGDEVLATDPETGETSSRAVVQLHRNEDVLLTDLTVRNVEAGELTTLYTTQNHPFWNSDASEWTDAAKLGVGTRLYTIEHGTVVVESVRNWIGHKTMRDLTVADVHTYYVLAGSMPVLVHNCDRRVIAVDSAGEAEVLPVFEIDSAMHAPQAASFTRATGNGAPAILTRGPSSAERANRTAAQRHAPRPRRFAGNATWEEYPYASSLEGGWRRTDSVSWIGELQSWELVALVLQREQYRCRRQIRCSFEVVMGLW